MPFADGVTEQLASGKPVMAMRASEIHLALAAEVLLAAAIACRRTVGIGCRRQRLAA